MRLEQTQQLLWKLITAPEGAADGMARLTPAERQASETLVRGDGRLSALERIDVYADMYFYRLRDALKEDFPAVCAVIGEDNFHNLITDYLFECPPSHFSLRYAGQALPGFVSRHPLALRWPYLGDVARLEWSIIDAFDAADAPPLEQQALAGIAPQRWADLRLELTPTLRLLALGWPVHDVWERSQRQAAVDEIHAAPTWIRVWRQDLRVFHRAIDVLEHAALAALAGGEPFGNVCEAVAAPDSAADGAQRVFGFLRQWLADGLLTGVAVPPETPGVP